MDYFFLSQFPNQKFVVLNKIYEPEEDSFLLAESIFKQNIDGKKFLDLGCGTGIQGLTALSKNAKIVFADINPIALKNAEINVELINKKESCEFIETDLFSNLLGQKFDLIVFNPPYLPNEGKNDLALDGGKKGNELLFKFLENLSNYLTKNGKCLFLASSINDFQAIEKKLNKFNFNHKIVARKKLFFEELVVFSVFY